MTTVQDICSIMESFAPTKLAMDWDNVGLMLGKKDREVKKILLALDLTQEVVDQALASEVQMIITHHPAIFKKISHVTDEQWQQSLLLTLAEHKIAVYSAHTNYDCALEGVNDCLANKLGLINIKTLEDETGLGREGLVESTNLFDFACKVKRILACDYVTYADAHKNVQRVAVCGGAGGELISLCLAKGVDTLVTGDIKYHTAQDAVFQGLNIVDAGHQATERIAIEYLRARLEIYASMHGLDLEFTQANESLVLQHV
ncbi:MAG: Nif3-like dinuclear metal center hexameric protein [Phascolarctobacterium sp.]|nr:Nif3-like dinuclear metal center hexameric protein [Phascolarctobacterium sp.]